MADPIPLRVLVFAASALVRRGLAEAIRTRPDLELVATCASPVSARDRLARDRVDVFLIEAECLGAEARDQLERLARERGVIFEAFAQHATPASTSEHAVARLPAPRIHAPTRPPRPLPVSRAPSGLVAIGSSTGGPDALGELIPRLPSDFPLPILVVQHMPANFTPILARRLEQRSQIRIREARDGDPLVGGTLLLAPGDFHLEVHDDGAHVRLHQGLPENSCRPAVDVLFRSVSRVFGAHALGLVLTGMGRDGVEGARHLRAAGAEVWVQDEASSVVWGMPGLVSKEGLAVYSGDLETLALGLVERGMLSGARQSRKRIGGGE